MRSASPPRRPPTRRWSTRRSARRGRWIANDDGSGARRLARNAGLPRLSPDGQTVAYVANPYSEKPSVVEVPAAGGTPKRLVHRWAFGPVRWSPDGRYLVAAAGGFRHPHRLKLIDHKTGGSRTLARGYFPCAGF